MTFSIAKSIENSAFVGLMVFVTTCLFLFVDSAFAQIPLENDIIMVIDRGEPFDDEAETFNNLLNVFTAAFIAAKGNLEIVALGHNTICIAARESDSPCPRSGWSENQDIH